MSPSPTGRGRASALRGSATGIMLIAAEINASERPLILGSDLGVAVAELLSVAYHLRPQVTFWREPQGQDVVLSEGFESLFVATPSDGFKDTLAARHLRLESMAETWQWFRAVAQDERELP